MQKIWLIGALFALPTLATAQDEMATEWALLLKDPPSMAFAPVTYASLAECLLAARFINEHSSYRTDCVPTRFSAAKLSDFQRTLKAEQEQNAKYRKAAQFLEEQKRLHMEGLAENRPALEAERRAILDDTFKLNQQKYAKRVLEIDALLRELDSERGAAGN